MSSLNVSEVAAVLLNSDMTRSESQALILPFISDVIPFDEEQAFLAANLQKATRPYGLSLGDRACVTLAQKMKIPVYTADRIWDELKLENVEIKLIR